MIMIVRPAERPGERVEREMRDRVDRLESGEQLPPVGALASEHRTSRATIQRVTHKLADEGLIVITPGWGTHKA